MRERMRGGGRARLRHRSVDCTTQVSLLHCAVFFKARNSSRLNQALQYVLSGLRPTGRVHLGNYFGAVKNWVDLEKSGKYRCFFFVADLHALTTDYADTKALAGHTREAVLDWLAVGL